MYSGWIGLDWIGLEEKEGTTRGLNSRLGSFQTRRKRGARGLESRTKILECHSMKGPNFHPPRHIGLENHMLGEVYLQQRKGEKEDPRYVNH